MNTTEDGPRFWMDENPDNPPGTGWVGVVDEEAGGIVAYFADWHLADSWIRLLSLLEKRP